MVVSLPGDVCLFMISAYYFLEREIFRVRVVDKIKTQFYIQ